MKEYRPKNNKVAIEVNCNPFSSEPVSINSFKGSYIISEHFTVRFGMNIRTKGNNKTETDNIKVDSTYTTQAKLFEFGLHPGVEYHFIGTKRLSPYVGTELKFGMRNCSYDDGTAVLEGTDGNNRAYTSVGFNLVSGADYYFTKHIYCGIEIGFGYESKILKEIKYEDVEIPAVHKEKLRDLGFNYNSAFRLGFVF